MKKGIVSLLLAAAMVLLAVTPAFAMGGSEAEGHTIEVTGSTSVYPLMEVLAANFMEMNPEVVINVSGTGSGDGVTGANTGVAEIGMASRNLKSSEMGYGLDELVIAVDAIAVVVNPENPVNDLSLEQIKKIYTGEVTNWSQVGGQDRPISVISREPGSGTRGAFEGVVGFADQLVAGAVEFDGTGGVRAAVAGNVNAIGYISLGSMAPEVKALEVNGVEATSENVVNGSYAVSRPFLILYREDKIHATTKKFLEYMVSTEVQHGVVAEKFVPVK
ncbi:MAG: phosphate ABC transporter substrate-binding protein [Spirochaetaceae bacterium]|nr:MAG: phosphate ABC transporter substrate-binding protein [Spirochaetaceae bacterium]